MAQDKSFFVGVDLGTTGCRVSFYENNGNLACSTSLDYPLSVPKVGWAQQDPEHIYQSFLKAFDSTLKQFKHPVDSIRSVSFSTVLHSLFPVDSDGNPLHPMLIFADTRAQECLPEIKQCLATESLYERTGCPLHPMYPLAKLFWFRKFEPKIFSKAHKFVSIKEYVLYRLTGKFIVDRSIASGTGLYNFQTAGWDKEALTALGLTPQHFSEIFPTTHTLSQWQSALLKLPSSVLLVLGAGDGVLSTLGAGAIGPGQFTAMIGTSGAVRICTPEPRTDRNSKNWCYNLTEDVWVIGGAINNGGLAFRWARDKFAATEQYVADKLNLDAYEVLGKYAEQKPPGSDGLLFLPFLSGERSPHWNANARGVLFGLNLNHGARHLIRATLEGILFSMYSVFQALRPLLAKGNEKIEIRASGSFTRSPFWVQMMADVFGFPIVLLSPPEGSAFGAAALGMYATGFLPSLESISQLVGKPRAIYEPNGKNHALYQELYGVYQRVYQNLLKEFDQISDIQARLSNN